MRNSDIIITSIEILFYLFHFSVYIVLRVESKNKFSGAFFNMLRLLFFSDIVFFITSFGSRLPAYGFFTTFYQTDYVVAKFQLMSTAYLMALQFMIHAFIPFNRFTLFWFPSSYSRIWEKQWYTVVILVVPFLMQAPWALEPATYIFSKLGTVVLEFVNPSSMKASLYLMFVFTCMMTSFAAIFNLLAIVKHFIHKYTSPDLIQLKEITFLYVSCFLFLFHCFYCFTIMGRTIFMENQIIAFLFQVLSVFTVDVISWSGSISLLVISKYARKAYFNFYRTACFGQEKTPVISLKVSAASKISTASRSQITRHM